MAESFVEGLMRGLEYEALRESINVKIASLSGLVDQLGRHTPDGRARVEEIARWARVRRLLVPMSASAFKAGPLHLEVPLEAQRVRVRSLWLHRAIVAHLVHDPARVIGIALANLARWRDRGQRNASLFRDWDEWERALTSGVDEIVAVCLGEDEHSANLRQSNPFPGVLGDAERAEALRKFQLFWTSHQEASRGIGESTAAVGSDRIRAKG